MSLVVFAIFAQALHLEESNRKKLFSGCLSVISAIPATGVSTCASVAETTSNYLPFILLPSAIGIYFFADWPAQSSLAGFVCLCNASWGFIMIISALSVRLRL